MIFNSYDPDELASSPKRKLRLSPVEWRKQVRQQNQELEYQLAYEKARKYALYLLNSQARSSGEVAKKLHDRGFDQQVVADLVARFQEVGLLDDQQYAHMLVRSRFLERGLVGPALKNELAKKQITGECAQLALERISADEIRQKARQLADKKTKQCGDLEQHKVFQRTISYLGRKGYGYGIAKDAAEKAWDRYHSDSKSIP